MLAFKGSRLFGRFPGQLEPSTRQNRRECFLALQFTMSVEQTEPRLSSAS